MGFAPREAALGAGVGMLVVLRTVVIVLITGWVGSAARSLFKGQ